MDAMLSAMTPEQFEERWLADSLDPIDDSWMQTAQLSALLHNWFCWLRATATQAKRVDGLKEPSDFIPTVDKPKKKPKGVSSNVALLHLKRIFGS